MKKTLGYTIMALAELILAISVFSIPFFFVCLIIQVCASKRIESVETVQIVSLIDAKKMSITGSIFLATGSISGGNKINIVYCGKYKKESGFRIAEAPIEKSFITETDSKTPELRITYESSMLPRVLFLPSKTSIGIPIRYEFTVPKGSIVSGFNIDLE